jgi:hypothetical protein
LLKCTMAVPVATAALPGAAEPMYTGMPTDSAPDVGLGQADEIVRLGRPLAAASGTAETAGTAAAAVPFMSAPWCWTAHPGSRGKRPQRTASPSWPRVLGSCPLQLARLGRRCSIGEVPVYLTSARQTSQRHGMSDEPESVGSQDFLRAGIRPAGQQLRALGAEDGRSLSVVRASGARCAGTTGFWSLPCCAWLSRGGGGQR